MSRQLINQFLVQYKKEKEKEKKGNKQQSQNNSHTLRQEIDHEVKTKLGKHFGAKTTSNPL